jgi:hypothetical protein
MNKTFCFLLATVGLVGCNKPASQYIAEKVPAAHFREGHGVGLPDSMCKSLGVKIADVAEQKISPRITIPLHVVRGTDGIRRVSDTAVTAEASGWITREQAKEVQTGMPARLLSPDGQSHAGVIQRVENAAYSALGDFEIAVKTEAPLKTGTSITAIIEPPSTGEVVAVPHSAVMKTVEGEFVYVVNEKYFKRTPVQTGARDDKLIEVVEGLYAGDQIVVAQVTPLWMTELQTLRAGQSCCKGQ